MAVCIQLVCVCVLYPPLLPLQVDYSHTDCQKTAIKNNSKYGGRCRGLRNSRVDLSCLLQPCAVVGGGAGGYWWVSLLGTVSRIKEGD